MVMVKIAAYLYVVPCCLVSAHWYCKVTFRDDASKCRLACLLDDGIHIVFDDGIEQYAKISSYVNNLTWIKVEMIFLQRHKMFYHQ